MSICLRLGLLLVAAAALFMSLGGVAQAAGVAYVNGQEISDADFNAQLREAAGHDVLTAMIEMRIITDAYVKSGLPLLDSEVTAFLEQRFGSLDNFRQAALQNGVNPDSYIERSVKPQVMLEKLALHAAPATPEALQKYYADHLSNYATPETVTLRQIVLKSQEDTDKAVAALQGGADFAQVAGDYSMDPSAKENGGLVENVPVVNIPPPLAQTLRDLAEGKHSEPLAIGQVHVILKLEKRTPGTQQTFEQAQAQVESDYVLAQTSRASLTALREKLRREARVHIRDKEFKVIAEELKKPLPSSPGYPEE